MKYAAQDFTILFSRPLYKVLFTKASCLLYLCRMRQSYFIPHGLQENVSHANVREC